MMRNIAIFVIVLASHVTRPSVRGEEPHPPRGNPGFAKHGGSRADHSITGSQVYGGCHKPKD
jgi:hypothetical protein